MIKIHRYSNTRNIDYKLYNLKNYWMIRNALLSRTNNLHGYYFTCLNCVLLKIYFFGE